MNLETEHSLLPGSQDKIAEYIQRVKNGEAIDSFQLSPKMLEAVQLGLEKGKFSQEKNIENLSNENLEANKEKIKLREAEDQIKIKELEDQIKNFNILNAENYTSESIEKLIDDRIKIKFETKIYNEKTGQVEDVSGSSDILDFAGRKIVLLNVKGKNLPFYLSTGHGGKADVTSGKWYPFFGIDKNEGWFNKLSGKEINNYYGSKILKDISEGLDKMIGDIRDRVDIQKVGAKGIQMDIINKDFNTVENGMPDTRTKLEKNINEIVNFLDSNP